MSEFIKVEIDRSKCLGIEACGGCLRVCPVNIFDKKNDDLVIIKEDEDECTLCDLCIQACGPNAVTIHKLYENQ
jgi:ferredoxin